MKSKFLYAFGYIPKVPFEVRMEDEKASNEYCKVLQKSIDDKFDYTRVNFKYCVNLHYGVE